MIRTGDQYMTEVTRELHPGMGQAVAERTVLRYFLTADEAEKVGSALRLNPRETKENYQRWNVATLNSGIPVVIDPEAPIMGRPPEVFFETWGDVAERVAKGNSMLAPADDQKAEFDVLRKAIAKATVLMSGRHLQHGDSTQLQRNMEVFTNCATAAASFLMFYLLLNGSGVGTSYDDAMCLVNLDHAPAMRCVLDENHPDFDYSAHESVRNAKHKYGSGKNVMWFTVPDTREGWAKAIEVYENAAFQRINAHKMLILDFSRVRPKGAPIRGMQNRPSSGPVPLMNALQKVSSLKGAGLPQWLQALYTDHYLAECVLVGGARRAARMATKTWRDKSVLEFIAIKRPIEYEGSSVDEVAEFRARREAAGLPPLTSFLWSANMSILVDEEFWTLNALKRGQPRYDSDLARHARKVYKLATECSYGDGTGEPGFINADKLLRNDTGLEKLRWQDMVGSSRYQLEDDTQVYMSLLFKHGIKSPNLMITNPCGEIALNMLGGFCVIADVVPFHADTLDEAEEAFRTATRALLRVNMMENIYEAEVRRTNRIGVGITGIHEFAWKFFGFGFRDLIDERKSQAFWLALSRFSAAVKDEARRYAKHLGVSVPHTALTIKPAGTTSKLFGLTEGWHLASMAWYIRWVQFRNDDPLVDQYRIQGYPVRELQTYEGTTIVGFPTQPTLASLGIGDKLVTAAEATPEEQYKWLMLGEKYYIKGIDGDDLGNQISYTLKYDPKRVSFQEFSRFLKQYQPQIRCCSVMPQEDSAAFEYQPEEPVTKAQYEATAAAISRMGLTEDIDRVHVECDAGACPIDFEKEAT
jgi:adenosylcobalamin-dependent ribonucleoside-triphosphate reductase